MYDQIREDTLYIMLYASVTMLSLMASCYLLFRRGNAFAPDVTSPVRLRRWTAAFFAAMTLSHDTLAEVVEDASVLGATSCTDTMACR